MKKRSKTTTGSSRKSATTAAKRKSSSSSRSLKSTSTAGKIRTGLNHKPASKKRVSTRTSPEKTSSVRAKTNPKSKLFSKGPSASSQDPIIFSEENKRVPKTHLTAKQLKEFKTLLLQKRKELAGDVQRLTDEALHRKNDSSNDHSTMPIHMADLGSDNWEQDFTLGLIASEEALVHEIDDALERIVKKTYGVCLATHNPISDARLFAKPWAKYCIDYARAREEGRA